MHLNWTKVYPRIIVELIFRIFSSSSPYSSPYPLLFLLPTSLPHTPYSLVPFPPLIFPLPLPPSLPPTLLSPSGSCPCIMLLVWIFWSVVCFLWRWCILTRTLNFSLVWWLRTWTIWSTRWIMATLLSFTQSISQNYRLTICTSY